MIARNKQRTASLALNYDCLCRFTSSRRTPGHLIKIFVFFFSRTYLLASCGSAYNVCAMSHPLHQDHQEINHLNLPRSIFIITCTRLIYARRLNRPLRILLQFVRYNRYKANTEDYTPIKEPLTPQTYGAKEATFLILKKATFLKEKNL